MAIIGSATGSLLSFNSSTNAILDGRINGTGTLPDLVIANSASDGGDVAFANGSANNSVQYCNLQGSMTADGIGLITFPQVAGTANNNNTTDHCNFSGIAGGTYRCAVYSSGSAAKNTGNIISNNNFADCFVAGVPAQAVYLLGNNTNWSLTGNRFYQSALRSFTANTMVASIVVQSGSGYNVSNNIIGFANNAGTGVATFTSSAAVNYYLGIYISAEAGPASEVQGNVISGIDCTLSNSVTTNASWAGIYLVNGSFNVGTTAGNIIGAFNGGAVSVTNTQNAELIYPIYVSGGAGQSVDIENNIIGGFTAKSISTNISTRLICIENAGASGNVIIRKNSIGNVVDGVTFGLAGSASGSIFTGIEATGTITGLATAEGNIIQNVSCNNSMGQFIGISFLANGAGPLIKDNVIANIKTPVNTVSTSLAFTAVQRGGTTSNPSVLSGNVLRDCSNITASAVVFLRNTTAAADLLADNNKMDNITKIGTGTMVGYLNGAAGSTLQKISNNIFTNINAGLAGFSAVSNGASSATTNAFNNRCANISNAGTAQTIIFNLAGTNVSCYGNSIRRLNVTQTPIAVFCSGVTNAAIYSNIVDSIQGSVGNAFGISTANCANVNIYKNRISNVETITTGGTSIGLSCTGTNNSGSYKILNNLISAIHAPFSSITGSVVQGISMPAATNIQVVGNTVYLNETGAGANFGSAAFFMASSGSVDLRNNIFINTSAANGSGKTVSFGHFGSDLTNYAAASNNNNFYAGIPSPANAIFYDYTNSDQTLSDFQIRAGSRESASVTENTTFISTDPQNSRFLHISPATSTLVGQAGISVPGFADDYDGQPRSSTPDMGADEFTGQIVVPVSFISISAQRETGFTSVKWSVVSEDGVAYYEVQFSRNGSVFAKAGSVGPFGSSGAVASYAFQDLVNNEKENYYRIKMVGVDGSIKYSAVIKLTTGLKAENVSVYPNPVAGGLVNVRFENVPAGKYAVQIISADGKVLQGNTFLVTGNTEVKTLKINSLKKGSVNYLLIRSEEGKQWTLALF